MPHEDVGTTQDGVDDLGDGGSGQGDGTARDGDEDLPHSDVGERSCEVWLGGHFWIVIGVWFTLNLKQCVWHA
jgi:hypothetical protein